MRFQPSLDHLILNLDLIKNFNYVLLYLNLTVNYIYMIYKNNTNNNIGESKL